jgi:flagellar biosynthetic protein FliP
MASERSKQAKRSPGIRRRPSRGLAERARRVARTWMLLAAAILSCLAVFQTALAQQAPSEPPLSNVPLSVGEDVVKPADSGGESPDDNAAVEGLDFALNPQQWRTPQGLSSALQIMMLLTVLSMAPAILLMTTSFIRIVVVLGLLRQALGTQQLPPSQVITSIALFMTLLIMTPVWTEVYNESIGPYTQGKFGDSPDAWEAAFEAGVNPIRRFMSRQIKAAGNGDDVWLFYAYLPEDPSRPMPENYDDVPLQVLLPAYMLSELKTAFLIGFQIYLPFLVLDIVIASVTISMGMMMLPPVMISLPFKLMLFVLVDGWNLVVGMLLSSFSTYG